MSQAARLLYTPIKVGNLVLQNRIVFSAHLTNYAEDNMPSPRLEAYYLARARGGAGLIITEEQSVHPSDHPYEKLIRAYDPAVIEHYKTITTAVHAHGTAVLAQINHNGGQSSGMYTHQPVWAPSPVPDPLFREVPKAMELEDIGEVIRGYALVAGHTEKGGFDGVELQCSHSSLVRQFLSRQANLRADDYGGSLQNRMRLLREIVAAIRLAVRSDYLIGVRLCGDELIRDGILIEEAVEMARALESDGQIDYLNTSIGTATNTLFMIEGSMHVPPGYAVYISSAFKKAVHLPVIGVGRIKDSNQAERILQEGHADLVGIVRGQISDPEFAVKARQGRQDEIRLCLSCNQECVGRMGLNRWLGCIQNPAAGREFEPEASHLLPAKKSKKILVVGGGPAGMRAAITASRRGHRVLLMEQQAALGGQINLATRVGNRSELGDLVRNMQVEMAHLPIETKLGFTASRDAILAEEPEAVVIACGSRPKTVAFPGIETCPVVDHTDILAGRVPPGKKVILIDQLGNQRACSTAEHLAAMGSQVELITSGFYAGQDLGISLDLETWHRRTSRLGVRITPNVTILSLQEGRVEGIHNYSAAHLQWTDFDQVVLSIPGVSNDGLYFELKGMVPELHRIGDCLAPRLAHAAILDGERVGRTL